MRQCLETWREEFLESRRLDRGASDKTIEAYRNDLNQFLEWLKINDSAKPEALELQTLEAFFMALSREAQKPSSLARKMSTLRQFFKFACLEKGLRQNPTELLASPKQEKRLPKSLSLEEVTALLAEADRGLPYRSGQKESLRSRDQALVYLLYATGMRISEALALTVNDLDLEQSYARVKGKGGKERITPFVPAAQERLLHYIQHHRPRLRAKTAHLFLNPHGPALTRQAAWKLFKALALQSGISASLSPHRLRHSFATHLLQSGMNLRSLQMLLGHADLSTTQVYAHVTPEHLRSAHRRFHPRGGG